MYSWGPIVEKLRGKFAASEELRVAVTFCRKDGGPGLTKSDIYLSLENVKDFVPDEREMQKAIDELTKLEFKLTTKGHLTASMTCTRKSFEKAFGTTLAEFRLDTKENYAFYSFYIPAQGAPWKPLPILQALIDDVYIQWPHIYMGTAPSVNPPNVNYYHLSMPKDVPRLLNATPVPNRETAGENISVVMIDSGFAHESHPFFAANGYKSTVVLAGKATDETKDIIGHGTGESVNIFSIAPHAHFIGVKIAGNNITDMWDVTPASALDGFIKARDQNPDIISISFGFDLCDGKSKAQRPGLPKNLRGLEAEILHAVASGITVVVAAGNGTFAFPGMMRDVISVGGVFVDQNGNMQASDLASAFESKIYPGRHVPDVCGLVGMKDDRYIMLPIPPGCLIDKIMAENPQSGTKENDGWAAFSGTSAAAPQIAGVCALLKAKNPGLTPSDIKAVLRSTARNVLDGHSNSNGSDDGEPPLKARPGEDGATGAGLVDAFKAWQQV